MSLEKLGSVWEMMSRLIPSHSPRANLNLHPKMLTQLTQASHTSIVTIVFVCELHPRTEDFYHWSPGCSPFFVFLVAMNSLHGFSRGLSPRRCTRASWTGQKIARWGYMTRLTRHFYKSLEPIGALDTCPCNAKLYTLYTRP